MAGRKVVWVSPNGNGGWKAKTEGASKAAGNFNVKDKAMDRAKEIAKSVPLGQVKVQKCDGTIQTEYTYGQDPRRYPG